MFIENGADRNLLDKNGDTALDLAEKAKKGRRFAINPDVYKTYEEIADMLRVQNS